MYVDTLVLEVTRRCNFKCGHCLRGPAQKVTMSSGIISKLLYLIDNIGTVTLTGGEPGLAVPVINTFIREARARGTTIGNFYCVTNGMTRWNKALAMALIDMYDLCQDNDVSTLAMSRDQYHGRSNPVPAVFKALKFFVPDAHAQDIDLPINEGYAEMNGVGVRDQPIYPFTLDYEYSDDGMPRVETPELYVAANGNIFSNCNCSYEHVDEDSYGNILTGNLLDILESHCTEESTNERLALRAKEAA